MSLGTSTEKSSQTYSRLLFERSIPAAELPRRNCINLFHRARCVVVSHPLSMREAMGSIPACPSMSPLKMSALRTLAFYQSRNGLKDGIYTCYASTTRLNGRVAGQSRRVFVRCEYVCSCVWFPTRRKTSRQTLFLYRVQADPCFARVPPQSKTKFALGSGCA